MALQYISSHQSDYSARKFGFSTFKPSSKIEFDDKEINEKMIILFSENIQAQEIEALQNSKNFPGRR